MLRGTLQIRIDRVEVDVFAEELHASIPKQEVSPAGVFAAEAS